MKKDFIQLITIDDPKSDFERDRALAPTTYLQKIREKIIEKIL